MVLVRGVGMSTVYPPEIESSKSSTRDNIES